MACRAVQFGKQLLSELHLAELGNEAIRLGRTNAGMLFGTLGEPITSKSLFGKARATPTDIIVLSALLVEKKKSEGMLADSERYGPPFRNATVDPIVINHQAVAHVETRTIVGIGGKLIFTSLVDEQETSVPHAEVIFHSGDARRKIVDHAFFNKLELVEIRQAIPIPDIGFIVNAGQITPWVVRKSRGTALD